MVMRGAAGSGPDALVLDSMFCAKHGTAQKPPYTALMVGHSGAMGAVP